MYSSPTREDFTEPLTFDEAQKRYAQEILDNRGYIPGHYAFEFVRVYWDPSRSDFTLDRPEVGGFLVVAPQVNHDLAARWEAEHQEELLETPPSPFEPTERKPVEGDCGVCVLPLDGPADTDDNEDKTGDGTELVWCQRQCGKNFHKSCIDSWLDQCAKSSWKRACPNCRKTWQKEKLQIGHFDGTTIYDDDID